MIEDQIKTTTRPLLIRGGTLIDGTGAAPFTGDVLVVGGRIEHIGDMEAATIRGADVLDATGMVVTPGFINILSHAYDSIQEDPRAASDILQGVTTEVFGEGLSPGPVKGRMSEHFPVSEEGQPVRPFWSSLREFLDHLEHRGVAVNVASFVGFANLRLAVAGYDNRPLTPAEVAEMSEILAAELADGALGLGSALVYPPESYSDPAELIGLGHTLHQHDALYISHLRYEDHRLLEGIDELLEIARSSGVRAEVFHLKSLGEENWPLVLESLDRIEQARAEGLEITADIYPYRASATYFQTIVPQEYHEGGRSRLTERLTSPAIRAQVKEDILHGTTKNMYRAAGGPTGLLLLGDAPGFAGISGKYLSDLAMETGRDALDLALDITAAKPDLMVAYFCGTEENARLAFSRPWVSVGSDAEAVAAAPLPSQTPVHPRAYGTFARILGQYVREQGLVPLEEAIRRMTSLPADTLRLSDRGRLVPGAAADIVVFDAAAVKDHATYEQPHQYADGMIHVVVNGVVTVRDGAFTGHFGGRALRRSPQIDPTPSSRSERNNVHVID